MRIPYIVEMGAAYTAALGLLVRRLRLPGRGYLPEKTLCSLLFVVVAAVCAALGSRPEAFWHLLPALLCCVAGDVVLALYNNLHRPGLFLAGLGAFLAGHTLFVWGLCRLQPMGWPVPLAAALGAGGAVLHAGNADRADAPLGGALRSLCLGTAGQRTAAGLWHRPALVLSGTGRGCAVLDFGSADPVFIFLPFQTHRRARGQSSDLLLCHVSDCSQPRVLRTGPPL